MQSIRSLLFCLLFSALILPFNLKAQTIDQKKVKVGLSPKGAFTTVRLQSFSGNWKVEFLPNTASSPSRIPLPTVPLTESLIEGEDVVLSLIPKGIVARFSTGKDISEGFGKAIFTGGELLNIEIPDTQPLLLQGQVEIDFDELSLKTVNIVNLHQFVVSSVSKFAGTNEPEALKALIVMARTRLAYLLENSLHPDARFDVCDEDHCLPFFGCGYNRELVDILSNVTKNKLLTYKGKLIFPRFQHTCGGKISSAKAILGLDEPYHVSKSDLLDGKGSENCFHSPGFHWTIELQKADILDFLGLTYAGGAERLINGWEATKRDENNRINEVFIRGRRSKTVSGNNFHEALKDFFGPNSVKSMNFNMDILRRTVIFRGMGQGNGVGLCLYGTDGLAKKNLKFNEILQFYYPGTEIK